MGHQLQYQREYSAALAEFAHALKADPVNWQAVTGAGQPSHCLAHFSEVIQFLERATCANVRVQVTSHSTEPYLSTRASVGGKEIDGRRALSRSRFR
jgi:hypothetical protein